MVRINGLFHLLINGVYWGYNPLTNHLLTSWDIQEVRFVLIIYFVEKISPILARNLCWLDNQYEFLESHGRKQGV